MDTFNLKFSELFPIFSTDPLHIFKNLRTRLFRDIVINPFVSSNSVTASKLNQILQLGPILSDSSQVAKMNDDFAIGLFNFKNSIELLNKYTKESFFYIFVGALWVEALQNVHLSPDFRIYLINILLRIFEVMYITFKENTLPNSVSFKKSVNNKYITIFTIEKMERIIPTLLATRYEICKNKINKLITLGRLGTHCAENRIGNVRSQSFQDQSVENLIHIAARYDYIKTLTKSNDDKRKKRLNQGGVDLNIGNVEFPFEIKHDVIADFLLYELGFIHEFDLSIMNIDQFKEILNKITEIAPYDPKVSFSSTKNHRIVDRYYSLPTAHDYVPVFTTNHMWTQQEHDLVDNCLSTGHEKDLYNILKYIPKSSLDHYIKQRKSVLAYRPLQTSELFVFNYLFHKKYSFKDIASVLPCRTAQSLKSALRIYD